MAAPTLPDSSERRCRRPARPPAAPGALRPSDMLAAFFVAGLAFLAAAAVVAVVDGATDWPAGHWLALHLAFVGGVSQLVLGAGQFFAGAFLATDPPPKRLIALQLGAWNAGAVLVAVGVPEHVDGLAIAGAVLLAAGLVAFLAGLRGLRRRSIQRIPWALRWYEACAVFLGTGVLAGVWMATGGAWTHGNLLGAHLALNLGGWFGTAIVGTLHTFFPSLTQTQLRHPRLQPPTFAAWTAGIAALAAGYAFGAGTAVVAGWILLTLAALMLAANVLGSVRATSVPLTLPARLVAAAQLSLLAGLVVSLVAVLGGDAVSAPAGDDRAAIGVLLVPGWLGLTVAGSLLHLLSVLVRVRDLRRPLPPAQPPRDRALVGGALAGVAALAIARGVPVGGLAAPAAAVLIAAYLVFAGLIAQRAFLALRRRPARPPQRRAKAQPE